jgi:hypothetical protein
MLLNIEDSSTATDYRNPAARQEQSKVGSGRYGNAGPRSQPG